MIVSKSKIKLLHNKRYRDETGLFLVEGEKSATELLNSDFKSEYLLVTSYFFEKCKRIIKEKSISFDIVDQKELERIGALESNDSVVVVARQKPPVSFSEIGDKEILIALDEIKDPGNLGTIIRIADWYGVKKIIASKNTVDFYNNKVVSASMGSFIRVNVVYGDLNTILPKINKPILGAFLEGEDIHKIDFPNSGVLLIGNESRGINKKTAEMVSKKILIPSFGKAESLNAAIATAVIMDNWRRNISS